MQKELYVLLSSLWDYGGAILGGTVVSIGFALREKWQKKEISWGVWTRLVGICVAVAFLQSWHVQYIGKTNSESVYNEQHKQNLALAEKIVDLERRPPVINLPAPVVNLPKQTIQVAEKMGQLTFGSITLSNKNPLTATIPIINSGSAIATEFRFVSRGLATKRIMTNVEEDTAWQEFLRISPSNPEDLGINDQRMVTLSANEPAMELLKNESSYYYIFMKATFTDKSGAHAAELCRRIRNEEWESCLDHNKSSR